MSKTSEITNSMSFNFLKQYLTEIVRLGKFPQIVFRAIVASFKSQSVGFFAQNREGCVCNFAEDFFSQKTFLKNKNSLSKVVDRNF